MALERVVIRSGELVVRAGQRVALAWPPGPGP